jgi:hypothetical protein
MSAKLICTESGTLNGQKISVGFTRKCIHLCQRYNNQSTSIIRQIIQATMMASFIIFYWFWYGYWVFWSKLTPTYFSFT